MTISVMIPTRDRCEDLRLTCAKLLRLRPLPDEILVWADGCTDGTSAMFRTCFPGVRLFESAQPMGSVYARDRMLRVAQGEIVLSLDDDSYPMEQDFIARLRQVMGRHPEAAVVAFPELRNGKTYAAADKTDKCPGYYVSGYANCAAAMRRRFYLEQPGFAPFFGHMYEEPDYALQCYAAGAAVWFEPTLMVRHHESLARRVPMVRHHQNARNELWSVWMRCPWPWLPLVSGYRVARQFVYAWSQGAAWAMAEPAWWVAALRGLPQCWAGRKTIQWSTYARWMWLARHPIYSGQELQRRFTRSMDWACRGQGSWQVPAR
jgi:GT2 family glycosyltransferase